METATGPYCRALLDAIPLPIFVVDQDIRIEAVNEAAASAFSLVAGAPPKERAGDVLHCINSLDAPAGCGSGSECGKCVIRNSVAETFRGGRVSRRRMKWRLAGDHPRSFELLITTSPVTAHAQPLALLILEDITETTRLHDIIPICARCKKVRDDQRYCQKVENYFHEYIGVDFSHGLCPGCIRDLYPDISI